MVRALAATLETPCGHVAETAELAAIARGWHA